MKNTKVDAFIKAEKKWKNEIALLREIALECGLTEEFKWRFPCYSKNEKNVAIIQSFKNSCAFMFFRGSYLKDPKHLLIQPGENSQLQRRLEFTNVDEVTKMKSALKAFIKEAIKLEESEIKIPAKKTSMPAVPSEFQIELDKNKKLKAAFEKLTSGRQRLYLIHISSAKQSATRSSRVEKCIPKILNGLGLND